MEYMIIRRCEAVIEETYLVEAKDKGEAEEKYNRGEAKYEDVEILNILNEVDFQIQTFE